MGWPVRDGSASSQPFAMNTITPTRALTKAMRVLLTGASGFLGQHALKQLRVCGIDTVVVGRVLPANCGSAQFKQVDLLGQCNFDDLLAEVGATHLLHLAWYAEHGAYWTSPLNLSWSHASTRLVEAFCKAGGQKVVMAGTCAEYDWAHGFFNEDLTPLKPVTLYGVAKDATRRLTTAVCAEHQVDHAWARIFLPYGQGEDYRRLLPSLRAVFEGKKAAFGVNTNAYRDFLHAEDVAAGFISLLQTDATGAYNISSGQPVQLAEVVRQIARVFGADPKIVLDLSPERPVDPSFLVGNNQKLKALGWQPKHSLADIPRSLGL